MAPHWPNLCKKPLVLTGFYSAERFPRSPGDRKPQPFRGSSGGSSRITPGGPVPHALCKAFWEPRTGGAPTGGPSRRSVCLAVILGSDRCRGAARADSRVQAGASPPGSVAGGVGLGGPQPLAAGGPPGDSQGRPRTPYNLFLERLKDPSCAEVVALLRRFVEGFPAAISRQEAADLLHAFITKAQARLLRTEAFAGGGALQLPNGRGAAGWGASPHAREASGGALGPHAGGEWDAAEVGEGLERFLIQKLFAILPKETAEDKQEDAQLDRKLRCLAWVEPQHLEIPPLTSSLIGENGRCGAPLSGVAASKAVDWLLSWGPSASSRGAGSRGGGGAPVCAGDAACRAGAGAHRPNEGPQGQDQANFICVQTADGGLGENQTSRARCGLSAAAADLHGHQNEAPSAAQQHSAEQALREEEAREAAAAAAADPTDPAAAAAAVAAAAAAGGTGPALAAAATALSTSEQLHPTSHSGSPHGGPLGHSLGFRGASLLQHAGGVPWLQRQRQLQQQQSRLLLAQLVRIPRTFQGVRTAAHLKVGDLEGLLAEYQELLGAVDRAAVLLQQQLKLDQDCSKLQQQAASSESST
ncbi:hypothetical protein Efla_000994 [Eimeria flavescens]